MSLPQLELASRDTREIARVLRGALRLRTEVVSLVAPPRGTGQHLLHIDVPGSGKVALLAELAGSPREDGHYPLNLRPVTRVQMAELFALIETLDDAPAQSIPPPPPSYDEDDDLPGPPEDTMVDADPSRLLAVPASTSTVVLPAPETSYVSSADSDRDSQQLELIEVHDEDEEEEQAPSSDFEISSSSLRPNGQIASGGQPRRPPSSSGLKQADKRIGKVLAGKYHIDAPIGAGAAATVYRATHKDLRRAVAVKILHAENQSESQFIRRFKSEALTASKLEHANVTRIIDFGQDGGELYLVMELVVGKSLDATLAVGGPMQARRVIDIGIQVCRALTFAHQQGVIHRDIKPENIMLVADTDDDGEPCDLVKVCDFGLAKLREPADGEGDITSAGMLCGSPAYMSPEQTRGDTIDARTDIYSLGVTMFEALTGALPYEAFSIGELFLKKCTVAPRTAASLIPSVDAVLDDIVARSMSIDPSARHASAKELRTELRAARDILDDDPQSSATILGG